MTKYERDELDEKDKKILELLQDDGRLPLSEVARKVGGITKVGVAYRLKRLTRKGIIEGFHARINPEKVGKEYVLITRVRCDPRGVAEEKVAQRIASLKGVSSVYQLFGADDLLVISRCSNKEEARNLAYAFLRTKNVGDTNTVVCYKVFKESCRIDLL